MKLRELSEGVRFGPSLYPQVLEDELLRVGYEIEFVWPITPDMTLLDWTRTKLDIRRQLKSLGLEFGAKTRWQLVGDGSIDTKNQGFGYELISPPMEIKTALSTLKLIFDWMVEKGCTTNESTGFHVNVSWGGTKITRQIDPLKVVLLLGERYLLNLFGRAANSFSESQLQEIVKSISWAISHNDVRELMYAADAQELINYVRRQLSTAKYSTVNIAKLNASARNGYFEFRIMGNKDYHKRYEEVKQTILRYGFLLQISFNPNAYRKEYLKELGRVVVQALSRAAPSGVPPKKATSLTTKHPERLIKMDPVIRFATAPLNYARNAVESIESIQTGLSSHDYNHQMFFRYLARYMWSLPINDPTARPAAIAIKVLLARAGYSVQDFLKTLESEGTTESGIEFIKQYLAKADQ